MTRCRMTRESFEGIAAAEMNLFDRTARPLWEHFRPLRMR